MKFRLWDVAKSAVLKEQFEFDAKAVEIGLVEAFIKDESVIKFKGDIYNCSNEFVVEGEIALPFIFQCSLCLKECQTKLIIPFKEVYKKDYIGDDFQSYTDNELDFTNAVYENIITNIPLKPLCNENCKGLCRQCGIDQNTGTCNCVVEYVNPKMAALKKLLQ